jgi:hypothetical protein
MVTLWLAVVMGSVMSALWLAYLTVTRRLHDQPFRKWDGLFYVFFIVLTAILIQWGLRFFNVSEIHQRRAFGGIAMALFLMFSIVINVIFKLRLSGEGRKPVHS